MARTKKKQKRQITNKLVAYYIVKKWDTPIDSLEIQKARVKLWAEKAGCEIVDEVVDSTGFELEKAFQLSSVVSGSIICAEQTRVAGNALAYFTLIEDEDNPIVFADVDDYTVHWLTTNIYNGLMYGTLMCAYEKYVRTCEKYLT